MPFAFRDGTRRSWWSHSHVGAQFAWSLADTMRRSAVEDEFEPGIDIVDVLGPAVGRDAEGLCEFWQVGSGDAEDEQVAQIMSHPDIEAAVVRAYC